MFLLKKYPRLLGTVSALLVATTLTACFSSGGSSTSTNTTTVVVPLAITSTAPVLGSTTAGANVKVVAAVFNKAIKPETLTEHSFKVHGDGETAVGGKVFYNIDLKTATFAPDSDLDGGTTYTATLTTAVKDESNKALKEKYVWTFIAGSGEDTSAPTALTSPEDKDEKVVLNSTVSSAFSKAIDPATVKKEFFKLKKTENENTANVSGSLVYLNPTTIIFAPSTNLEKETNYTFSLSTGIKDIAGVSLEAKTITFTTGSEVALNSEAVDLRTAGEYVILAETGISNTGETQISGNIAVSPASAAALTGFEKTAGDDGSHEESRFVIGKLFSATMMEPTPALLTTAIGDLKLAYTDAAGRVDPDATELGAGQIGGLTIAPGLYKWSSDVLVSSNVTLKGSDKDVWIFQIAQNLKLEDGKKIILSGGALPENVFWQVAGDVTLQAGTIFNGIILTQTGVAVKSKAVINGRILAQTAVTLIANEVNEPTQ